MNKNNEPYFPVDAGYPWGNMQYVGITKRDYFASMAMQGLCTYGWQGGNWEDLANTSYRIADAMLKASK